MGGGGGGCKGVHLKRGGLKIAVQSGNPLPLIMGISLAISRRGRGVSHQPALMDSCLTISDRCLPLLPLFKKTERLYPR